MSILLPRLMPRRRFLRGVLDGVAVSVALPFLDCFLDVNGKALAATGAPVPIRFGTWYWGMGHTPGHAITEKRETGPGIGFLEETIALKPLEKYLNFFGGFAMPLDGHSNYTHYSGWVASRTGAAPTRTGEIPAPTLDLLVADVIGGATRFKTIDVTAVGIARENYSARGSDSRAAAEASPVALYRRLFGPGFVDPNKTGFKPDTRVMVQKSALSAVLDESRGLMSAVGAEDRQRLDEYFTSVRQIENQLALQLTPPAPNQSCRVPAAPPHEDGEAPERIARDMDSVLANHAVMSQLLAMAVACNQTNVFNMVFTDNMGTVRRNGETYTHHLLTHEEAIDPSLGYQPLAFWFNKRISEGFATFLQTLASIREGDGTLLDNCLVFASSETNYARVHTIDGLPMWLAGKAGGRVRTGVHVVGRGESVTRVGLTALKVMGVPVERWGTRSLQTSKPLSEVLV